MSFRPQPSRPRFLHAALLALAACAPPDRRETVADLAAAFPLAEVRREVAAVDFGTPAARPHLAAGWGGNERGPGGETVVRNRGGAAVLEIFLVAARDLRAELRLALPAGPAGAENAPTGLAVEINGCRLPPVPLWPGFREVVLPLPRAILHAGTNRLAFRPLGRPGGKPPVLLWDLVRFRPTFRPAEPRAVPGRSALELPAGTQLDYFLDVPAGAVLAHGGLAGGQTGARLALLAQIEEGQEEAVATLAPGDGPGEVALPGAGRRLLRLSLRALPAGSPPAPGHLILERPLVQIPRVPKARSSAPAAAPRGAAAARPNVLLYLVDTLRADRLGAYGCPRPLSPRIDELARRSYLFEEAIAQAPWTKPAVASILTGLGPLAHGATALESRLPGGAVTLAELLRGAGYRTAGFSPNGHVSPATGLAQGFDHFELFPERPESAEANRRALAWLDRPGRGTAPFFLYVHTLDPHAPYEPPADLRRRLAPRARPGAGSERDLRRLYAARGRERAAGVAELLPLYDAEVAANDRSFGALADALAARDLFDGLLVVLVSDHGEGFDEHGELGHARDLHAEVLDVPLIVKLPFQRIGRRVARLAQHVDLLPTILGRLRIAGPPGLPGTDLFGPPPPADQAAFSHLGYRDREGMSVVAGGFKLIEPWSRRLGRTALFDRGRDPDETADLHAENPVRAGYLRARIRAEARRGRERLAPERAELGEEERRALSALGYH